MQNPFRLIPALLAFILFVSACAPSESPEEVEARIATSVAMTVAAQGQVGTSVAQTLTAQSTPLASPTSTLRVTSTPIQTFTPLPTATPFTSSGGGGGGGGGGGSGGSSSTTSYACAWVGQKPNDGYKVNPEVSFDVVWTVKNTGTKPILVSESYLSRTGGDPISNTPNLFLAENLKPGKTVNFRIEVQSPVLFDNDEHIFITVWSLIVNGTKLCKVDFGMRVQRPPW
ncbi:MAG: hypothetical protein A2Y54_04750 [Chloroflexi bacterium RBG_16_51_16]|nr:MAG: hypothetical protein A2Y54_04750 [Chloroflexi bacterium RBG_16_51_16]